MAAPFDPRKRALEDLYSLSPEAQSAIMTPGVAADYSDSRAAGQPTKPPEDLYRLSQRAQSDIMTPGVAADYSDAHAAGAGMGAVMRAPGKPARPTISLKQADTGGSPRGFQSLAQYAPPGASVGRDTSSKGPDDAEFAAAQDEADRRRGSVALGRFGAQLSQAISGQGYDAKGYDDMQAQADSPVARLLAQRQADAKKRMDDPTSEESKRFQAAVAKSLPGVYTPAELAHMTAGDADMVLKTGAMRQRLDERKADMAREDAMRAAQQTREDAIRHEGQRFQLQEAGAGRAFQAAQADKAFQRQLQLANLNNAADLQQALARAKVGPDGKPLGQSGIPGLEVQPGAAPTEDDAKKMKDSLASAQKVHAYVDELSALHDKYGTELGGAAAARMSQLRQAILLEAKNIGQLGALSGDDMKIVDDIMGSDPTSLGANAKAMVGVDNTQAGLQGLKKWVDTAVDSNMQARGYQRKGGGQQPQAGAAQPQRIQKNGKTYTFENGHWVEEG